MHRIGCCSAGHFRGEKLNILLLPCQRSFCCFRYELQRALYPSQAIEVPFRLSFPKRIQAEAGWSHLSEVVSPRSASSGSLQPTASPTSQAPPALKVHESCSPSGPCSLKAEKYLVLHSKGCWYSVWCVTPACTPSLDQHLSQTTSKTGLPECFKLLVCH